ncbi:MAG: T9SS type A sorting domain-containing protein [candidate division KSB1 bacterium]|nr:T9SS type A sorting domain-containing protein [candidate division KSB1 bacterium]
MNNNLSQMTLLQICMIWSIAFHSYPGFAPIDQNVHFGRRRDFIIPPSPPGKNFRTAAIYFKLANDEFELGRYTASSWPHTESEPNWKGQFLIDSPYDPATFDQELKKRPESITAYFYQMSGGKLWIYGDEVTYKGPPLFQGINVSDSIKKVIWLENNTKIIQWFADNYPLAKLDNNSDGVVDFIILICRARPKFGFQGLAALPINKVFTNPDEPQIIPGSGIYQTDCYTLHSTRHIVSHEIGHCLGFWNHLNGLHRWNLMSGSGHHPPESSGVTMSAYEKNYLGWLQYDIIDTTTFNVTLSNLTESNKAICIPIKDSPNYFVVESRQYSKPFEPDPKQIGVLDATIPGTGLLVYYVDQNGPNIIPADGQVTKVIVDTYPNTRVVFNGDNTDLFGNYGRSEITLYTKPSIPIEKEYNTHITIKNIRYKGKDMVFDIIYNYSEDLPQTIQSSFNFNLHSYPNPFRLNARIYYHLPQKDHVRLIVYNIRGQKVATLVDEFQESWTYEVVFYGHPHPSGIYFYCLETSQGRQVGKMILLRNY